MEKLGLLTDFSGEATLNSQHPRSLSESDPLKV